MFEGGGGRYGLECQVDAEVVALVMDGGCRCSRFQAGHRFTVDEVALDGGPEGLQNREEVQGLE